jgi:hypothetical protein
MDTPNVPDRQLHPTGVAMKQDARAPFDWALHRARLSAYPPGEFVGQEGFMPHTRESFADTALAELALLP